MGTVVGLRLKRAVIAALALLTPALSAQAWTPEGVESAIRRAWGGDDAKAIQVARCESGLDPKATSPDGRYLGLWQFDQRTWRAYGGDGPDPRKVSAYRQTLVAWRLYRDRGWAPWPVCGRR